MNEIILTSSVLILFIATLRRLLRGRISPTLQYALWLLVAARLLIPGTLFTAPVTLVGLAEDVHSAVVDSISEESPPPAADLFVPAEIPGQSITITLTPLPTPEQDGGMTASPVPQTSPAPVTPDIDWRNVIWNAGVFAVSFVFFISNLMFYRKLRRSRQRIPAEELPVPCPVPVYYVDDLDAPCLFGLRSAVYVNTAAMYPGRLRHVLVHELTHRRHGDHIWSLLRCVCLAVHWYNPLVWWAALLSRRDCEMSCDSAAIHRLGEASGISYGETLMAMLTTSATGLLHTATTMNASKRTMMERLKLIVHRPRMMKLTLFAVALITMGAVMFTFGGCADNAGTADSDKAVTNFDENTQTGKNEPSTKDPANDGMLTPPENGFGFIPSSVTYTHPSGLFSMELPALWHETLVSVETEDGVKFYAADYYQTGSEDGWLFSVHPQPADWTGCQNPTLLLAEFDPNGTPQTYLLEYNSELSEKSAELWLMITDSFLLNAAPEQFSRLIHDSYKDNIALAISYLPYLSWQNYRTLYGEDVLMMLLNALWVFADAGNASWSQYHDILSTTNDGLDGAHSEGLSAIFESLYLKNSERFLSVINSAYITDTERARVAAYVKYGIGSEPDEGDSEEVTFNDTEVMMGLARSYGPTAWSTGSPMELTLTLTGDWTLDGIRAALYAAVSEYVSGTILEGDLHNIEIGYSFRFPEEMRDGITFTVPFHATYVDQDVHILPSGATHSPSSRTDELTATIQLVGEGITGPVDEEFARGQAIYDLLAQLTFIEEAITVSHQEKDFQLLSRIHEIIDQKLADAGLSDICRATSMSCGSYYNPLWCDVGYEQTVEYSVSLLYTEGDRSFQYTFHYTVTVTTTE